MRRAMVIESRLDQIGIVREWMRDVVERVGLGPREAFDMTLAVHEAVVNAILHGNAGDPSKQVEIQESCQNGCLTVSVRDQGAGFNVRKRLAIARAGIPDDAPRGRGLMLITRLADEVAYNTRGNEVRLTKNVRRH